MKYYIIQRSLDTGIMGFLPQVKTVITNCHIWDEPKFIQHHAFQKVDFDPFLAFPVLEKKANLTDLISHGGMGLHTNLVASDILKTIFYRESKEDFQYFPISVFHHGIEYSYWLIHPTKIEYDMVDFEKSEVWLMEHTFNEVERLAVRTVEDFLREKERITALGYPYSIRLTKFTLKESGKDFFVISGIEGGFQFFVSETLKQEIDAANCTGIEFMPATLTFNEWAIRGGLREQIYGKP